MQKVFLIVSGISGALSVAIGAFGAHGLKAFLEANNRLETFETAVKYQFYHTFALMFVGLLMSQFATKSLQLAGGFFIIGILIFSGSLYLLCAIGIKWLGAITPIGGLFLIAGWLMLAFALLKS
ncbi:MAG TPA: DUF423 domain-containing protein [Cytophagales bacterium]|nr:DUF423 domain-containing protein [Cytophagales bacterium]